VTTLQQLEQVRAQQAAQQEQDREAAGKFLQIHQQLAKLSPGPEKAYLIDTLGQYAGRALGTELPKEYLAMLKRQNEEQGQAYADFLDQTVKKYDLGLTGGVLPLIKDRPDLLLETLGRELDFKRREAITAREFRDEKIREQLLQVLPGGGGSTLAAPPGPAPAPSLEGGTLGQVLTDEVHRGDAALSRPALSVPQARGVEGAYVEPAPSTALGVGTPPASRASESPEVATLDRQVQAYDRILQVAGSLSPTPENQRFLDRLQTERDRYQKDRDGVIERQSREEERSFRREQALIARQEAQQRLQMQREELAIRRQERAEERPFKGLSVETREILRAKGIGQPTPEDISSALDEKRTVEAEIKAQQQRAAAEIQAERVDPVQARQLASLGTLLGHLQSLERYTKEDLEGWVGPVQGRLQRLQQLYEKDPRYQDFYATSERAKAAVLFSRTEGGGGALTPKEFEALISFNLSTTDPQGALAFATNLAQMQRDVLGKIRAIGSTAGVRRGEAVDKALEIAKGISAQSAADVARTTQTFGPGISAPVPSGGPPGGLTAPPAASPGGAASRLKGMTPQEITAITDQDLAGLTKADLAGLSAAQLGALRARMQKKAP